MDGVAHASVLTDYVDWNYASPPSKPKDPRTPPTPELRGEAWARWMKEVFLKVLDDQVAIEPDLERKRSLDAALKHIQGKWNDR
jgi:hypothetical protein